MTDTRESCTRCGMVANVDPSLHAERYGHDPVVRRDGVELEFDWETYTFGEVSEDCPRCHAVSWGQTPDGRDECTRCLYAAPRAR